MIWSVTDQRGREYVPRLIASAVTSPTDIKRIVFRKTGGAVCLAPQITESRSSRLEEPRRLQRHAELGTGSH